MYLSIYAPNTRTDGCAPTTIIYQALNKYSTNQFKFSFGNSVAFEKNLQEVVSRFAPLREVAAFVIGFTNNLSNGATLTCIPS